MTIPDALPVNASAEWHRGDWMQTFTGRAFYPLDPSPADIDPVDIAHSLAMQCRYNGHVQRFYSVAEHCVLLHDWFLLGGGRLTGRLADERSLHLAKWALLHDAAEAYIGDMVRPLKVNMPDFCRADELVTTAVAVRFHMPNGRIPVEVKDADTRILLDERAALLTAPPRDWSLGDLQPLGVTIHGWNPAVAEKQYLTRLKAAM